MAKNKTVKCRKCGAEIASIAMICPSCGAKNKKPFFKKVWPWILVIFMFFIAIGSCGNDEDLTPSTSEYSSKVVTSEEKEAVMSVPGEDLSGGSMPAVSSETNSVSSEKVITPNTPFDGDCGIVASGEIGNNIIDQPMLTLSIRNTTEKDIKAICFYCIPYDVYGDEIKGIFTQNKLYTDDTVSAGKSVSVTWDFFEDRIKTVKLYVYSVYFADGTEWGNKDATRSSAIKNGHPIEVEGEA